MNWLNQCNRCGRSWKTDVRRTKPSCRACGFKVGWRYQAEVE